jgi:hypothetical protein
MIPRGAEEHPSIEGSRDADGFPRGSAKEPELSVVIPCLNEATTIAGCVERALGAMGEHGIVGEVVVSDNGSTDGSVDAAMHAGARVVNCPARGYGAALQWGFRHARGRYLLMGDADESYDFSLLPRFVEKGRAGHAFVMGSRFRGRIEDGAMPALNRYVGTPVLTWVLNRLFGTRISDCNCGMRLIRRDTFLDLDIVSPGMEFASEMIVKAAVRGVPIAEVPIDFFRDRRNRRPHLRRWRDGWRHLRLLLWHAPDHMLTIPGLIMLALGLPLVGGQLAGPLSLAGARFDIHYMVLGTTLSLLGLSASSLGMVVGSAMPKGMVRHVRLLTPLHRSFTFDRVALVAGVLLAMGFAVDASVLAYWLYHHQGALTPLFTRMTLLGMLLLAAGVQLGLSALLLGTTGSAIGTAPVRELLTEVPHHTANDPDRIDPAP